MGKELSQFLKFRVAGAGSGPVEKNFLSPPAKATRLNIFTLIRKD